MNTANLQLEGLYLAIAAINNALVAKGLLSREDISHALQMAEEISVSDYHTVDRLTPSNRDAIAFPARLLRMAINSASESEIPPFSELAKLVGQTKEPYNDQL